MADRRSAAFWFDAVRASSTGGTGGSAARHVSASASARKGKARRLAGIMSTLLAAPRRWTFKVEQFTRAEITPTPVGKASRAVRRDRGQRRPQRVDTTGASRRTLRCED